MKILFCTDGSKISYNALHNFAKWNNNAQVDIICVVDWSFLPDEVYIEESGFTTSCANIACSIVEKAKEEIQSLGFTLNETFQICGSATNSIEEQILLGDYDLVVMGSHGKKGIQKWLGSVSRDVITNTKTSGYISKGYTGGLPECSDAQLCKRHTKILFTTDGSPHSFNAIKIATENFNLQDKDIYICTVIENPDLLFLEGSLDSNWLLEIEKRQKYFALKLIQDTEKYIKDYGLEVFNKSVISGIPSQAIIDFSAREEIDLIVLGGKLRDKTSILAGSMNKRILDNTKADVMIIKSHSDNIA